MPRAPRAVAFWLCCWMAAPLATTVADNGSARAAEPAPARHASTPAERQARGEEAARNFMQGRYEEALATFLDLYIQSDGRPEYLRNIGRCQQKLKQYPQAIESFKDYLRRARHLSADERKEVQGFISEMETEKKAGGTASGGATPAPAATLPTAIKSAPPATPPAPVAAPAAALAAAPVLAPAAAPAPARAPPVQPYQQPTPPPAPSQSWPAPAQQTPPSAYGPQSPPNSVVAYNGAPSPSLAAPAPAPAPPDLVTRAPEAGSGEAHTSPLRVVGIVSLVAAAAAAGGGTLALMSARSTFDDATKNGCPNFNSKSYCDSKASAVASANLLSKILYIGAGVVGIAGITMIVAAPSATPDGRVSLALSGRF